MSGRGTLRGDSLSAKIKRVGFREDWGGLADLVLREWTARFLGVPVSHVAERVTFVLSGRCPGVITPHIPAVTREWEEVKENGLDGPGHGC